MPNILNIKSLMSKLKVIQTKAQRDNGVSVITGYTKNYAVFVHENEAANHPIGQAKYLEQPARELRNEFGIIVATAMKNEATLAQALVMAGLRLQRASQKLVPIDTGDLKGSAFTRKEK